MKTFLRSLWMNPQKSTLGYFSPIMHQDCLPLKNVTNVSSPQAGTRIDGAFSHIEELAAEEETIAKPVPKVTNKKNYIKYIITS